MSGLRKNLCIGIMLWSIAILARGMQPHLRPASSALCHGRSRLNMRVAHHRYGRQGGPDVNLG